MQSDRVRDYVIPIATGVPEGDDIKLGRVLGSAFLIGSRGYALTASHVIAACDGLPLFGMFVAPTGEWRGFPVQLQERHPVEDVAVIRLGGGPWKSFFRLANTHETASCRYRMFGYPDDTTYELEQMGRVTCSHPAVPT